MERVCWKCRHHAVCRIFERISAVLTAEGHGILAVAGKYYEKHVQADGDVQDIFVALARCCLFFDGIEVEEVPANEGQEDQPEGSTESISQD